MLVGLHDVLGFTAAGFTLAVRAVGRMRPGHGGSVKAAWDRVMATKEGQESLDEAIRSGLKDRRQRLGFLELGARLSKEIGSGAEVTVPPLTVTVNGSRLDPSKRR